VLHLPIAASNSPDDLGSLRYIVPGKDESVGQFISVGPQLDAGEPAQFNAYSYAFNNPVSMSDPSGMDPKDWQIPGMAAASDSHSGVKSSSGGAAKPSPSSMAANYA
jgi:hypothetical protein